MGINVCDFDTHIMFTEIKFVISSDLVNFLHTVHADNI